VNHINATRIVLVDDHVLFAESLATVLEIEGYRTHRVRLEGRRTSVAQLCADVIRLRPGIVLLDLDLAPVGNGLDMVGPLAAAGITVVVVTCNTDRARWGECVEHGARKVIPKYAPLSDIVATVRRIDNGLPTMAADERAELLERWHDQKVTEQGIRLRLCQLTRREGEVLGMLMAGLQVGEIARQRFVSESTVRTQVKAILAKLQVGSQLTAVGMAHKAHWRPPAADGPTRVAG
jgi:DNA-binding NarL/FixJ family response regulator